MIDQMFRGEKLALAFECRVGKRRLLVCSVDLDSNLDKRMVARQLRHSLFDYLGSDAFNPKVEISPTDLSSLLLDNLVMKKIGAKVTASAPGDKNNAIGLAIDGDPNTYWQSPAASDPGKPNWLEVEFPQPVDIDGITYMSRQNERFIKGCIRQYRVEISTDGSRWTTASEGVFPNSFNAKTVRFDKKKTVKKLRLTCLSGVGDDKTMSCAELTVLYAGPKLPPNDGKPVVYKKVRTSTAQVVESE